MSSPPPSAADGGCPCQGEGTRTPDAPAGRRRGRPRRTLLGEQSLLVRAAVVKTYLTYGSVSAMRDRRSRRSWGSVRHEISWTDIRRCAGSLRSGAAASSLPWIDGQAPCYPAYLQVTRYRKGRSYGASWRAFLAARHSLIPFKVTASMIPAGTIVLTEVDR